MTTYLIIHEADRTTERCAVRTRHAAVREINSAAYTASGGRLWIDPDGYGDGPIDDDFRDFLARHLGEDSYTGAESILPITTTDDPIRWDIVEHIDYAALDPRRLAHIARIAVGRSSSGSVTVEQLDLLADVVLVTVVEDGDHDNLIRTHLRLAGRRWREALQAALQPVFGAVGHIVPAETQEAAAT